MSWPRALGPVPGPDDKLARIIHVVLLTHSHVLRAALPCAAYVEVCLRGHLR